MPIIFFETDITAAGQLISFIDVLQIPSFISRANEKTSGAYESIASLVTTPLYELVTLCG
jgi:hypothetical protein